MLSNRSFVFVVFALCIGFSSADTSEGECVICDSTKDANCAQRPDRLGTQKCQNQVDSCYVRIVEGNTYRGCLQELDEGVQKNCTGVNNCFICENANGIKGCNNLVWPIHRLTCHSCSGDLKSDCFKAPTVSPLPCRNYKDGDYCYIRKTEKSIERGCLSETSKCQNISHCSTCSGEGCNNDEGSSAKIPTAPSSAARFVSTSSVLFAILVSLMAIS